MHPAVERTMGKLPAVRRCVDERGDGRLGATLGSRPGPVLRTIGPERGKGRDVLHPTRTAREIPVVVLEPR